jgi:hypothetical protein
MTETNPYQPVPVEPRRSTNRALRLPLILALIIAVFLLCLTSYLVGFYQGLGNSDEMERRGEDSNRQLRLKLDDGRERRFPVRLYASARSSRAEAVCG